MWNVLPLSVRPASSMSGFEKGVRDYLTSKRCLIMLIFCTFWCLLSFFSPFVFLYQVVCLPYGIFLFCI